MTNLLENRFRADDIAQAERHLATESPTDIDPRVERLVNELIGRIADKWTLLVLELLEEKGTLRFTEIGRQVEGISQKMLTQTLRHMERDGLLTRTVHPVVPPRVDYALTPLGNSLSAAFCGVWVWAERHRETVEAARAAFDARD
ncbi:helix-turn-helix domain-containing protein [Sphingobium sp. V4]|jgi:DNA-binding HxlR family transcriptional regulator|uniref:winged helix-turn-helix transcriptional regulator n=1 Tax=Sphingobium sp. V4 TaxID=3038927 RepID=UPI002557FB2D|nr:helix-turn-helix domain-containing protein [Sphingobium sp. V4]WIW88829.1 helix-turn-helix domain-containing protein [Sphingobium sp. V4]